MDPFVARVAATIRQRALLRPEEPAIAAVSGGPDSTALAAALAELGHPLHAVHVHHGLRVPEGDRDEQAAVALARRLRLPFQSVRANLGGTKKNIEEAARVARIAALSGAARTIGIPAIATGHTRDDQAETVLYRVGRGAGPRGLRGILPRAELQGGLSLVRPLLDVDRADVLAYLQRRDLPFVHDSSNDDLRFSRNRLRHETLPSLERARPGAGRALASLADSSRELWAWIEREASAAIPSCRSGEGLDLARLATLPPPVRDAILEMEWRHTGPFTATVRRGLVRIVEGRAKEAALGGGWMAIVEQGVVRPVAPPIPRGAAGEVEVPGHAGFAELGISVTATIGDRAPGSSRMCESFDADLALSGTQRVRFRPRLPGDRFRPLGAPGGRSLQDFLVDRKVPRRERGRVLVALKEAGDILWVVGHRIDHAARITESTRRVLTLDVKALPT